MFIYWILYLGSGITPGFDIIARVLKGREARIVILAMRAMKGPIHSSKDILYMAATSFSTSLLFRALDVPTHWAANQNPGRFVSDFDPCVLIGYSMLEAISTARCM